MAQYDNRTDEDITNEHLAALLEGQARQTELLEQLLRAALALLEVEVKRAQSEGL